MTLLLHGLIVSAMAVATYFSNEAIEEYIEPQVLEFEDVELVALGKPRDPSALPRIANPAPPKRAKREEVVLDEPPAEQAPVEELTEHKVDDPAEEVPPEPTRDELMKDAFAGLEGLHDPERPVNEDVPEGQEDGVVEGTLSQAAGDALMRTYSTKVNAAISKQWRVPATLDSEQIEGLSGEVVMLVYLSEDGYIREYRWDKRSQNEQFNLSIESALRRFRVDSGGRKLPLPDNEELRQLVLERPLRLSKWEYKGR